MNILLTLKKILTLNFIKFHLLSIIKNNYLDFIFINIIILPFLYANYFQLNVKDIPILNCVSLYITLYCLILFIHIINLTPKNKIINYFIKSIIPTLFFTLGTSLLIYQYKIQPISKEDIFLIFQTNYSEAISFIKVSKILYPTIIIFIITYLLLIIFYIKNFFTIFTNKLQINITLIFIFLIFFISLFIYKSYTSKDLINNFFEMKYFVKKYDSFLNKIVNNYNFKVLKNNKTPKLHIVIIGESSNKEHYSANNYYIKTTPFLENIKNNNNIVIFTTAYSKYTKTISSINSIFTNIPTEENLINILNKGEIETIWLSNQTNNGLHDIPTAKIANSSNQVIFFNNNYSGWFKSNPDIDVFIPYLKKFLPTLNSSKNKVIFIHTMGSHFAYCDRIQKDNPHYKKIQNIHKDINNKKEFFYGNSKDIVNQDINCYDESIYLTDKLIQEVYNLVKNREDFGSLTYFSDHGEDVFTSTFHSNNSTVNILPRQAKIFILTIFSNKYIKENPKFITSLKNNKDKIFSSNLLFHYFQSLLGVYSQNSYNKNLDISKSTYSPTENDLIITTPFVYRKKIENFIIQNDPILIAMQEYKNNPKIWMHRVHTIGKMMEAKSTKANGIETDVYFQNNKLLIGHGAGNKINCKSKSGCDLDEFLHYADFYKIHNIWLDIKDVNEDNVLDIIKHIEKLSVKYPWIKNSILIETEYLGNQMSILSNQGYKVLYFIPHHKIQSAYKNNNQEELKQIAQFILKNIQNNNLSNISFDFSVYKFVKQYIEPHNNKLNYYTWDTGQYQQILNLNQSKYISDNKLKVILRGFNDSRFQH